MARWWAFGLVGVVGVAAGATGAEILGRESSRMTPAVTVTSQARPTTQPPRTATTEPDARGWACRGFIFQDFVEALRQARVAAEADPLLEPFAQSLAVVIDNHLYGTRTEYAISNETAIVRRICADELRAAGMID